MGRGLGPYGDIEFHRVQGAKVEIQMENNVQSLLETGSIWMYRDKTL